MTAPANCNISARGVGGETSDGFTPADVIQLEYGSKHGGFSRKRLGKAGVDISGGEGTRFLTPRNRFDYKVHRPGGRDTATTFRKRKLMLERRAARLEREQKVAADAVAVENHVRQLARQLGLPIETLLVSRGDTRRTLDVELRGLVARYGSKAVRLGTGYSTATLSRSLKRSQGTN